MKSLVLLLVFFCSAIELPAQNESVSSIHPLNVGDIVTDIEFSHILNYPSKTARLSDFKGRLVILDFWATWCSSCIHSFPDLDSLQKKFAGQLQIILVNAKNTGDDEKKATAFFEKRRMDNGSKYQLPAALYDTVADQLFRHTLIPHCAWIDGNRNVVAITSSEQVTEDHINALLNGKPVTWAMKKDQDIDKPLFAGKDLPEDSLVQYSIFLKGQFDGLPGGTRIRTRGKVVHGIVMTNTCLLQMYQQVAKALIPGFTKNSMILQVKDSSDLIPDTADATREQWYMDHAYNFDLIVPIVDADKLNNYILEDLNKYSGYFGKIEKRRVKCLVLENNNLAKKIVHKQEPSENNLAQTGALKYLQNQQISILVNYLNGLLSMRVLDETGFTQPVYLKLPADLADIPALQKALLKYGFILVEAERELNMLVLTEKSNH
jgi:thiol-disulfide isomerase/thioredoxin